MPQYTFEVGDQQVTGTLAEFAGHWKNAILGGPVTPCLLRNETGETTRIKVELIGIDDDLEGLYLLSVGDDTTTATVSDLA
jgi:hypothetical protein